MSGPLGCAGEQAREGGVAGARDSRAHDTHLGGEQDGGTVGFVLLTASRHGPHAPLHGPVMRQVVVSSCPESHQLRLLRAQGPVTGAGGPVTTSHGRSWLRHLPGQ